MEKKSKKEKKEERLHKIPLRITDTTLRDAHQSLWATRMRTGDILEILDVIDSIGYYSLEVWGGATFDVCLRFLRENPWERLRKIKAKAHRTPLQMLLRGQNLVGYRNYADDVVDRFVMHACENGIDIFRVFDALNDTRNLEAAVKAVKKHGGHAQGTLAYTISPLHTVEKFVRYAKEQVALGIDSLCIKDMAGILSPIAAERLVGALVREVSVPIQLHCHASSGMATATYVEGVRAGAGAIDCAISSMAGFSSQPPVESLAAIFSETDYHADIDVQAMARVARYFAELYPKRAIEEGMRFPIDPQILIHQIPGGMISNFRTQLQKQGALDKLEEVLAEVSSVRKDLGYPPLVTPTSQIVGTQAVMNVIAGERYKIIPNEVKDYLRGLYGRAPGEVNPHLLSKVLGDEKPIDHRPADDIAPMLRTATDNVDPQLIENEEDIISYIIYPQPALEYFKWRQLPPDKRPETPAETELQKPSAGPQKAGYGETAKAPAIRTEGEKTAEGAQLLPPQDYQGMSELLGRISSMQLNEVMLRKGDFTVSFKAADVGASSSGPRPAVSAGKSDKPKPAVRPPAAPAANARTVNAPLVGTFYLSAGPGKPKLVKVGDVVEAGAPVCIVEAMKLFNEIKAPCKCKIAGFLVSDGTAVVKEQPLVAIEEIG
jgi:oxaloacetate decarboxylase alpha subunit